MDTIDIQATPLTLSQHNPFSVDYSWFFYTRHTVAQGIGLILFGNFLAYSINGPFATTVSAWIPVESIDYMGISKM